MKFNKQLAVILILLSMLLSAVAVSVYFYNQNQEVLAKKSQLVTIFIANKDIKKDTKITKEHIKKTTIARQYVLTNPLLKNEILNKYAKEAIYKNEVFLKEKLSPKIVEKIVEKTLEYKYNSYNMALDLFQNPNFSLKPDDIIKIISVYPKNEDKNNFVVQYIAKNIRVVGFLRDGYETSKSIEKKKINRLVNKKQVEEIIDFKADEIVLDVKQEVLLSLINNYNKGKQLWMVKSKIEEDTKENEKQEKKKIKELFKNSKPKKLVKKVYTPRSYPVKWYRPETSVSTKTATISYANDKKLNEIKKAKITSSFNKECSNTKNLLIVVSNRTLLRKNPSKRAKIHKTVYKNYVLSYISASKINTNWYVICDGSYVNSEDVMQISYDEYKKLK